MERRSVELADTVICGSAHLLGWMRSAGYDLPARAFVWPNVFPAPDPGPVAAAARAARDGRAAPGGGLLRPPGAAQGAGAVRRRGRAAGAPRPGAAARHVPRQAGRQLRRPGVHRARHARLAGRGAHAGPPRRSPTWRPSRDGWPSSPRCSRTPRSPSPSACRPAFRSSPPRPAGRPSWSTLPTTPARWSRPTTSPSATGSPSWPPRRARRRRGRLRAVRLARHPPGEPLSGRRAQRRRRGRGRSPGRRSA